MGGWSDLVLVGSSTAAAVGRARVGSSTAAPVGRTRAEQARHGKRHRNLLLLL